MDSGDPKCIIIAKIRTLEPDNASQIIAYFLFELEKCDLIRMAFGPDTLIQSFCRKAKFVLGLPSNGVSLNPSSRPINIHDQSLSQSSPRNGFLEFSRNPNPLSPSLTSNTLIVNPNFNSSPFHEGSSQQQLKLSNHFPQQRIVAAQFMAACGSPMSHRQGSAQFGEEGGYCYSPGRHERENLVLFSEISKKIFFTFPPESSFTQEDASTYFSKFGAVEDVRIPDQQQRVFGFVTFANAETVRTILAQGSPHFIGVSLVRVKPYKEKGKIRPKRQQQQQLQQMMEGRNCSISSGLSGLDSRELKDCRFGPRMFSNKKQEMLRRKTKQAYLQQAVEVEHQRRRILNLQLLDMENKSSHHHQHSPSIGFPAHFPPRFNHSRHFQSENNEEIMEGDSDRGEKHRQQVATSNGEKRRYSNEFYKWQETNVENTLPDSLFGSPKTSGETRQTESDTEHSKEASSSHNRHQQHCPKNFQAQYRQKEKQVYE